MSNENFEIFLDCVLAAIASICLTTVALMVYYSLPQ